MSRKHWNVQQFTRIFVFIKVIRSFSAREWTITITISFNVVFVFQTTANQKAQVSFWKKHKFVNSLLLPGNFRLQLLRCPVGLISTKNSKSFSVHYFKTVEFCRQLINFYKEFQGAWAKLICLMLLINSKNNNLQ